MERSSGSSSQQHHTTGQQQQQQLAPEHSSTASTATTPEETSSSKGCEVYVTRVPRDLQEKDLHTVFSRVGKVRDLRLMMEPSGINRGYAYIRYYTPEDAKQAIQQLNNYEIQSNRYLVVTKSVDNRRLWINGIPKSKSVQEIRADIERQTAGVVDIILYPSQADKSKSRGYMFVEYESHKAAALARRKLCQGSVSLCGHEVGQVDWAEPENEVDETVMATVRVLFVRNLMLSTTEEALRALFNRLATHAAGEVERVKKTKDFAFIHFTTRAAAEAALAAAVNNNNNGGGGLMIEGAEVEVLWSKPVDKKLYNTRKTLTKAFTLGSEIVDNESGTVQSISPRRRGAAGIRGLGAPGTAPSKQLVQQFCSLGLGGTVSSPLSHSPTSGASSGVGSGGSISSGGSGHHKPGLPPGGAMALFRSAPDLLLDICLANRWGEPIYTLTSLAAGGVITSGGGNGGSPDTSSISGGGPRLYIYRVAIPQFPFPPPHNQFQSYSWRITPEEARTEAAHFVLACLRVSPDYLYSGTVGGGTMAPHTQAYPVTPAALQGLPLTIATVPPAPATMYSRMVYTADPYSSAYNSLLSSMYSMNVTG